MYSMARMASEFENAKQQGQSLRNPRYLARKQVSLPYSDQATLGILNPKLEHAATC
jgi:hypothetical protein